MSIPDQYLVRAGTFASLPSLPNLAFGLGGRFEGIPVRDVFGPDDGFRRPGYAVSVEPSVVLAHGGHTFSLAVPVAVMRNRQQSIPDKANNYTGDAAFADWLLLFSWSFRF